MAEAVRSLREVCFPLFQARKMYGHRRLGFLVAVNWDVIQYDGFGTCDFARVFDA